MKKQKFIYTPAVLSMRERDERLVHLVLCGNEDAWNTLYQEAVPWVTCAVKGFDRQNFFPDDEHKDIVDEAIENAEGGGIKKAFGSIFSKKYNENDYLILHEKDFE